MEYSRVLILIFLCNLCTCPICLAGDDEKNGDVIIPPGMETIKEGDVNIIVPKGGEIRKQSSVMLIETADEYSALKFLETESRFSNIENELEEQKNELEEQKNELKEQKKKLKYLEKGIKRMAQDKTP